MANPAFGKPLNFCGTSSRVCTRFVVALVIVNQYTIYVHYLVLIETPKKTQGQETRWPCLQGCLGSSCLVRLSCHNTGSQLNGHHPRPVNA